jgi:hypothetical protein
MQITPISCSFLEGSSITPFSSISFPSLNILPTAISIIKPIAIAVIVITTLTATYFICKKLILLYKNYLANKTIQRVGDIQRQPPHRPEEDLDLQDQTITMDASTQTVLVPPPPPIRPRSEHAPSSSPSSEVESPESPHHRDSRSSRPKEPSRHDRLHQDALERQERQRERERSRR